MNTNLTPVLPLAVSREALPSLHRTFTLIAALLGCWAGIGELQGAVFSGTFLAPPATNDPPVHFLQLDMPGDGQMQLNVATSPTLSFALATIGFYDSDQKTLIALMSTGAGTNETKVVGQLRAGTYYLGLKPSGLTYGTYVVTVLPLPDPAVNDAEPNDTAGEAKPAGLDQATSGHIGYQWQLTPYDRNDYWRFTLPEDGAVDAQFDARMNFLAVDVRDITGNVVLLYSGGIDTTPPACPTCTNLLAPRLKAGDYVLRIGEGYAGVTWGGYTFRLNYVPAPFANDAEPNDASSQAQAAALGTAVTGHIGYQDSVDGSLDGTDWWRLAFPSGGDLRLGITTTTNLPLTVEMFKPDGVTLAYLRSLEKGESTNVVLRNMTAGTYWIRLSVFRYFWGSYSLSLDSGAWGHWLDQHFSPLEMQQGTNTTYSADPDKDGIANLAEFAFGLNPLSVEPYAQQRPQLSLFRQGTSLQARLVFKRPTDRVGLLKYSLARSEALPGPFVSLSAAEEILDEHDGIQTVRFTDLDAGTGLSQRFYRVSVEMIP